MNASKGVGVPSPSSTHEGETSDLSCKSCKRKKARCDRLLPRCSLCERFSETCDYPATRLKPGPKAGSRQRKRRPSILHSSSVHVGLDEPSKTGDHPPAANPNTDRLGDTSVSESRPIDDAGKAWTQHADFVNLGTTHGEPASPDTPESSHLTDARFIRAMSLSAMVHPSHDTVVTSPPNAHSPTPSSFFSRFAGTQNTLIEVCNSLDLSIDSLQTLTDCYFDNMTAFSLFHQPSFGDKIQDINSCLHLKALLASMFSISARFLTCPGADRPSSWKDSHRHFHQLAMRLVDEAISECDVEPPPICIIQALVLCTFYELAKGVHGRAWRLLGTCVRAAYEQRLNLIDSMAPTSGALTAAGQARWSAMEEKRRLWWAIWQMDIFASTVRRLPTAIDQTINETYLPVSDHLWFQNTYQASCFLDPVPAERPIRLKKSGNDSDSAWFIVLDSIMRSAQILARGSLHSALSELTVADDEEFDSLKHYFHGPFRTKHSSEDGRQLFMLLTALQQTVAALPPGLAYQGTTLSFGTHMTPSTTNRSQLLSARRSESAQHAIYLMTQMARFMIYHHFAFSEILLGTIFSESGDSPSLGWTSTSRNEKERLSSSEGLQNCLQASDDIFAIVSRSSESHVQWTNPFLASTVWLAASLQVLRKVFAPATCDDQSENKIQLLREVNRNYTDFWDAPQSLLNNLNTLEERLARKKTEMAAMEARHLASSAPPQKEDQQNIFLHEHHGEHFLDFSTGIGEGWADTFVPPPSEPQARCQYHDKPAPVPVPERSGQLDWIDGQGDSLNDIVESGGRSENWTSALNHAGECTGYTEAEEELSFFISSLIA